MTHRKTDPAPARRGRAGRSLLRVVLAGALIGLFLWIMATGYCPVP